MDHTQVKNGHSHSITKISPIDLTAQQTSSSFSVYSKEESAGKMTRSTMLTLLALLPALAGAFAPPSIASKASQVVSRRGDVSLHVHRGHLLTLNCLARLLNFLSLSLHHSRRLLHSMRLVALVSLVGAPSEEALSKSWPKRKLT